MIDIFCPKRGALVLDAARCDACGSQRLVADGHSAWGSAAGGLP